MAVPSRNVPLPKCIESVPEILGFLPGSAPLKADTKLHERLCNFVTSRTHLPARSRLFLSAAPCRLSRCAFSAPLTSIVSLDMLNSVLRSLSLSLSNFQLQVTIINMPNRYRSVTYDHVIDLDQLESNSSPDLTTHPFEILFASVALFVLRAMRSKPTPGHVRLEWFCTCGVQMYADYPESDDVVEFQESLGDTQQRSPCFAHMIGDGGRSKLLRTVKSRSARAFMYLAAAFTLVLGTWLIIATDATLEFILGLLLFAVLVAGLTIAIKQRAGELYAFS
jgi:hypothetical protein